MKKIFTLLLILINIIPTFSEEYPKRELKEINENTQYLIMCRKFYREESRLKIYNEEIKKLFKKALNRPSRTRIDLAFRKIFQIEYLIDHITTEHFYEINKNELIDLLKTKIEIYELKKELFLLRKTLVE